MEIDGILSGVRGALSKLADFLASVLPFPSNNIYTFIILAISIYASAKIVSFIPSVRKSWAAWIILAAVIYYAITSL